ncbi:hypothetical protein AB0D38_47820 [Streptomyces sp. NPDC048279]
MNPTLRAPAACAPAEHHATVAAPDERHDPKEDVELDDEGRPDTNEE